MPSMHFLVECWLLTLGLYANVYCNLNYYLKFVNNWYFFKGMGGIILGGYLAREKYNCVLYQMRLLSAHQWIY